MPLADGTPSLTLPRTASPAIALGAAAVLAACGSTLLAYNVSPSSTQLNQCLALVGWGSFVAVLGVSQTATRWRADQGLATLLLALGLLVAASAVAPLWAHVPLGIAYGAAGTLVVTILMLMAGAAASASGRLQTVLAAIAWAWLIAGLLSLAAGAVQVFAPDLADGDWVARTAFAGRAVGNLRQPNHLSSLLLWSAISVIWLAESSVLKRSIASILYALMIAGIVMSASRTGLVGVVLLTGWGLFDKGLSRAARITLIVSLLIYVAVWMGLASWAHHSQHVFGAEARLTADGDLSSSRFGIWSNTLEMIRQHPWAGVGFGGFNFAWSLSPFPHRPVAFFDHTHNIVLQFIVELGLPLGLLVIGLMGHAIWRAFDSGRRNPGLDGIALRCAFMMVLMMALHSQLEYPLWYAYFLLPTALVFGLCLGRVPRADAMSTNAKSHSGMVYRLTIAGFLVAASGVFVLFDYMRVVAIFAPPLHAAPLAERIEDGEHSWFFSHHADYAAVTTADHPSDKMAAFKGATHYLLDTRLMIAWAKAYAEAGDLNRARNIVARLHEFHNEKSEDFFAECDDDEDNPAAKKPFQCEAPASVLDYPDFE
jgi:O-antigen ligase